MQPKEARGVFYRGGGPARVAGRLALVLAGALAAGVALGGPKPSTIGLRVEPIVVEARPIAAFDKANPNKTRFGKLTWRGGLILTSPSPNFGGWSGLALDPDGKRFLAVSDAGTWMTGALVYDRGRPKAVESARLGPLQSRPGMALARNRDRDAEGLAIVKGTPAKGSVLISFERDHRIARFDIDDEGLSGARGHIALPAAGKRMKSNQGLEAITVLRGGPFKGSLVAIAERLSDGSGSHTGWLWVKGRPRAFQLRNRDDFDVTDAAGLSDGSLLVLERRFRWSEGVKMRLRLIRRNELVAGARIAGETLLDASLNHEIDNMEGLAVHTGAGGEIIVTMISDDNFNPALQRTVLLQFALEGADLARAAARP